MLKLGGSAQCFLADTVKFRTWLRLQLGNEARLESEVERDMAPHRLRVEGRQDGRWTEIA